MYSGGLHGPSGDQPGELHNTSATAYLRLFMDATSGNRQAQYDLAAWHMKRVEVQEKDCAELLQALQWYRTAATAGHACAQYRYGLFFEHGWVVACDDQAAERWIRQGLKQCDGKLIETLIREAGADDADALNALGCAYFFGYGVEQDNERCFALWKRAAALGSARGFYHLSCAYHSGTGTEPDTELSIACCRTACELGMGIAAHRMGLRYLHGNGVSINHDQAYQFFRLGVLRGYSLSLGALRFCLAAGLTRGSRSQIGGRKEDA